MLLNVARSVPYFVFGLYRIIFLFSFVLLAACLLGICRCGRMYYHLWREAHCVAHRRRAALRKYLAHVYARLLEHH